VLRVLLARDVADIGYPDFTLEDLHADWATPGLDLERDARVVEAPGGEIVASSLLLGDDALIFVHPDACGRGIGTALREHAEERARERGCRGAHLDTFEYQALPFYQKLGYELFGTLDDFPPGYRQFYLRKRLDP
jgi:GNAT superfamily N-acetyltransferase